jgi:hypothetical protein
MSGLGCGCAAVKSCHISEKPKVFWCAMLMARYYAQRICEILIYGI